jgi:squalene-hopene/tetraprenyl-beta-curcumene cyclase
VARLVRRLAKRRSLDVLQTIQPSSGGFLEATPLTSFVTLSLASIGQAGHPVARKGVEFLVKSVRPDGSWPIDTNLATWVTTLSVNALAAADALAGLDRIKELRHWLVGQQFSGRHPYTGADPGGWGWTDLPGSVPDADDTPGALLALFHLEQASGVERVTRELQFYRPASSPAGQAAREILSPFMRKSRGEPIPKNLPLLRATAGGLQWLLALQNRDGGWPTFCRGWGHLPFDRSGSDLTAHVIRALKARVDAHGPVSCKKAIQDAIDRGLSYLRRHQRLDGSWLPLWFGNQHVRDDENPTYGTARVLAAYRDLDMMNTEPARRGVAWLLSAQNPDGGWGGAAGVPSSMEETALAVEVLIDAGSEAEPAVNKGLAWLVEQVEAGGLHNPTPIGFYFAKLWYYENLYPMIFTVAALGRARRKLANRPPLPHRESIHP